MLLWAMLLLFDAPLTPTETAEVRAAMQQVDAANDRWLDCALGNLRTLVRSSRDAPHDISAAAVNECSSEALTTHLAIDVLWRTGRERPRREDVDRAFNDHKTWLIDRLAALVVQARARANH